MLCQLCACRSGCFIQHFAKLLECSFCSTVHHNLEKQELVKNKLLEELCGSGRFCGGNGQSRFWVGTLLQTAGC